MSKKTFMGATKVSLILVLTICSIVPYKMVCGEDSGLFGYPYMSSEAIGSGHHEEAVGSRFTLTVEAGVTSISCLMQKDVDPANPSATYSYAFAIYTDNNGSIGNLVAQTVQGVISNTVPQWETLSFSSPLDLTPEAYWLLVVHDAINFVMISDVYNSTSSYETVTSDIGGLTFPTSLNSPIYTPGMVCCIYAAWGAPAAPGSNTPSLTSTPLILSTATQYPVSLPPLISPTTSVTPSPSVNQSYSPPTTSVTSLPSVNQSYSPIVSASPQPTGTISDSQSMDSSGPPASSSSTTSFPSWLWILLALMAVAYIIFSLIVFLIRREDKKKQPSAPPRGIIC